MRIFLIQKRLSKALFSLVYTDLKIPPTLALILYYIQNGRSYRELLWFQCVYKHNYFVIKMKFSSFYTHTQPIAMCICVWSCVQLLAWLLYCGIAKALKICHYLCYGVCRLSCVLIRIGAKTRVWDGNMKQLHRLNS